MLNIDRNTALTVCKNLRDFHEKLKDLYSSVDIDLTADPGRRNILMSAPMEHFLALELSKLYSRVDNDGRTGQPDIVVVCEDGSSEELECKLTSPHKSSGAISFQTDYETLEKKGSLDYVYLVASRDFRSFCFVHFEGLTIDDFRSLSPGARGKVQMYKYKGMKKAKVIVGQVVDREQKQIEKLKSLLENLHSENDVKNVMDKVYTVNEKIKIVKSRNSSYTITCEEI